jgi:hypothetical protein
MHKALDSVLSTAKKKKNQRKYKDKPELGAGRVH